MDETKQPTTTADFLTKLTEQLSRIETLLEEDHKALRGNGHKGALDRLTDLENKVGELDRRQTEFSGFVACVSDLKADIKILTSTVNGLAEQVKAFPQMRSDLEMLKGKRLWWRDLIGLILVVVSIMLSAYAVFR